MADCCSTDTNQAAPCPECGQTGPVVGEAPVHAHRPDAEEGPWQHCPTVGCSVVFHLDAATVDEDEVRTRVGSKAVAAPEPVCFCFGHTRSDMADDIALHDGVSTIKADIKAAVADGLCACEHLNPQGSCCLGAVHRAIVAVRAEIVTAP